jgi:acyl-CoA dehydrogenase
MRTIGSAELALASMIHRANSRRAFGKILVQKDTVRQTIAEARIEIAKCRQLCYLAACMADEKGFKAAKNYIAMIKVAAPQMALKVIDDAIQLHGAHGISQDSKLGEMCVSSLAKLLGCHSSLGAVICGCPLCHTLWACRRGC